MSLLILRGLLLAAEALAVSALLPLMVWMTGIFLRRNAAMRHLVWLAAFGVLSAWWFVLKHPERGDALRERFSALNRVLVNKYYFDWFNENVLAPLARERAHAPLPRHPLAPPVPAQLIRPTHGRLRELDLDRDRGLPAPREAAHAHVRPAAADRVRRVRNRDAHPAPRTGPLQRHPAPCGRRRRRGAAGERLRSGDRARRNSGQNPVSAGDRLGKIAL